MSYIQRRRSIHQDLDCTWRGHDCEIAGAHAASTVDATTTQNLPRCKKKPSLVGVGQQVEKNYGRSSVAASIAVPALCEKLVTLGH